ncbi:MAG: signal peptidase I [Sphingomonas sp.]|uniref:signal peptidase I n=1 Tax=Sphingomonas sp. TaxID=28214 RepID=UPI00120DEE69|nr:signal peptidase I [Sphingomonas sp.]THD36197.1 MAG: signal peptidase I [Sphingomonas sp.]
MTDTPEAPIAAPEPTPTDPAPATVAAKPVKKEDWRDTLKFLLKLAVVVFIFRSFLFSPFSIPSQSMLPRLYIGDYLFISKWNYGYSRHSLPWSLPLIPGRIFPGTPARGDVVVFKSPTGSGEDVIKRVIGLPGDTIQMRGGQLILNGQAIPKVPVADFVIPLSPNYRDPRPNDDGCPQQFRDPAQTICRYKQFRETLPAADGRPAVSYNVLDRGQQPGADDTDLYSVPAGHIFVMGDNRDDSGDSRFPVPEGMGYVPLETVEGKAVITFWSTDGSAQWLLPWTWFTAARWSRMGQTF